MRKAIQNQLPTASNLKRWGRSNTDSCRLCHRTQTNKHIFSNCSSANVLKRYTYGRNKILEITSAWLRSSITDQNIKMFANLDSSPADDTCLVFHSFRPDMIFVGPGKTVTCLELTVCHESNLESSRARKVSKYNHLSSDLTDQFSGYVVQKYFIEVTVLGFISDFTDFLKAMHVKCAPNSILEQLSLFAINLSQKIYWKRDNNDDLI